MKKANALKLLVISLLILMMTEIPCVAQGVGDRYVDKAAGISYQPPTGWVVKEIPRMHFKGALGPFANQFTPNMNFVDKAATNSLQDFVDESMKKSQSFFKEFVKLNQTPFTTAAGQAGIKVITQAAPAGHPMLRRSYYFFDLPKGKKLVVTCTALAKGGEAFDKVFDESLKTLVLGN